MALATAQRIVYSAGSPGRAPILSEWVIMDDADNSIVLKGFSTKAAADAALALMG